MYEEVPKDPPHPVADRYGSGEVSETTRLVYTGLAASADDVDGGYLSATASEASGAASGFGPSSTSKKVEDSDYIEMNGANGVGPVKASNVYVQPKLNSEILRKSGKPISEKDIHIYTNQLDSALDEVGYLRPLPPVPCGIEPLSYKHA